MFCQRLIWRWDETRMLGWEVFGHLRPSQLQTKWSVKWCNFKSNKYIKQLPRSFDFMFIRDPVWLVVFLVWPQLALDMKPGLVESFAGCHLHVTNSASRGSEMMITCSMAIHLDPAYWILGPKFQTCFDCDLWLDFEKTLKFSNHYMFMKKIILVNRIYIYIYIKSSRSWCFEGTVTLQRKTLNKNSNKSYWNKIDLHLCIILKFKHVQGKIDLVITW